MAKINIPNNLYQIFWSKLVPSKASAATISLANPCKLFTKDENHYVMNVVSQCQQIKDVESFILAKLNIHGTLEINVDVPFHWSVSERKPKSNNDTAWNVDLFSNKELIINANYKSDFEYDYSKAIKLDYSAKALNDEKIKSKLEKITINSETAKLTFKHSNSLKEITITASKPTLSIQDLPALKKLNLPNLKYIKCTHYTSDFNPFNVDNIPSDCILTLNKNINFEISSTWPTLSMRSSEDISIKNLTINSLMKEFPAKSYKENKDNTFSIRYDEFILALEGKFLKSCHTRLEQDIQEHNTQKQIIDSMIKTPIKTQTKIK